LVNQQLAVCLQLVESIHQLIRAGKWQKLSALESEYSCAFAQLKAMMAAGDIDADDLKAMVRLEQQQRRLQKLLSLGLKETGEKLAVIDDASKRLQNSSKVASALAAS
jgi:Fe-S cluster assembly scaffold protein SufB